MKVIVFKHGFFLPGPVIKTDKPKTSGPKKPVVKALKAALVDPWVHGCESNYAVLNFKSPLTGLLLI